MIDARFRPLEAPPYRGRKQSSFKATWGKTLDLLERELQYLRARDIIVQAGFELSEIRNDGWPRGGRAPHHPAVVLSFRSDGQSLSFPCDTFTNYEDNLRAIALSLEALRAVNRYGVTKGHEQYRGFAQIEAPRPMTVEDAAQWIAPDSPQDQKAIVANSQIYRERYRAAARLHFPHEEGEVTGGMWQKLQEAKDLLDRHHGLKVDQQSR